MQIQYYVIQHDTHKVDFWNKHTGWAHRGRATQYTAADMGVMTLPLNGLWKEA